MICRAVDPADVVLVVASGLFDEDWYVRQYPDVAQGASDPLEHFMTQGWTESRSPGPHFDTYWYARRYLVDQESLVNPLVHYLTTGWRHGEWPTSSINPQEVERANPEIADLSVPVAVYVAAKAQPHR